MHSIHINKAFRKQKNVTLTTRQNTEMMDGDFLKTTSSREY